jgi:hypothetical protein
MRATRSGWAARYSAAGVAPPEAPSRTTFSAVDPLPLGLQVGDLAGDRVAGRVERPEPSRS